MKSEVHHVTATDDPATSARIDLSAMRAARVMGQGAVVLAGEPEEPTIVDVVIHWYELADPGTPCRCGDIGPTFVPPNSSAEVPSGLQGRYAVPVVANSNLVNSNVPLTFVVKQ